MSSSSSWTMSSTRSALQSPVPSAPPLFDDDDDIVVEDEVRGQGDSQGEALGYDKVAIYHVEGAAMATMATVQAQALEQLPPCQLCLTPALSNISILECAHRFHIVCLSQWLKNVDNKLTCPTCNETAVNDSSSTAAAAAAATVKPVPMPMPDEEHPLEREDMSMDELARSGRTLDDIRALNLTWKQALRLGLRREHFHEGWLGSTPASSAASLFGGVTWDALKRAFKLTVEELLSNESAAALKTLGITARQLIASGELDRRLFLETPFTLRDWVDHGALTKRDLTALALTRADYDSLMRSRKQRWVVFIMEKELGFSRDELKALGLDITMAVLDAPSRYGPSLNAKLTTAAEPGLRSAFKNTSIRAHNY
jgi:ribosomal protein L13E